MAGTFCKCFYKNLSALYIPAVDQHIKRCFLHNRLFQIFISAMAVTGAYYDVPMGEVQKPGKVRDTFIGLSEESAALGRKLGIEFKEDIVEYNLKVIDKLAPESTASMQKDIAKGHESEVQGLLFDMITAAEEQGIDIPTYRMVAEKFRS